jgi:uncharacterized protein (DUF1810 family)
VSGDQAGSLDRFLAAQAPVWDAVAAQLAAGRKTSHWMWFVFPQLGGLGSSPRARHYGLAGLDEARAYLAHPLLGERLRWSVAALLAHAGDRTPAQMLGRIDAQKLMSCLTLFDALGQDDLFARALTTLYDGARDEGTLALLRN